MARMAWRSALLLIFSWLVLSLMCHTVLGAVDLKVCNLERARRVPQTYTGKLRIQWDSWPTSQITTALAAIILSENMGFDVVLEDAFSAAKMYEKLAEGQLLHLAFETWPASNPNASAQYAIFFNGTSAPSGKVNSHPYINLFGRAGIYETCSRSSGGCASLPRDTGVLLKDVLKSPHGQEHFNTSDYVPTCSGAECEFVPQRCTEGDCDVHILHIAKTGYDEGLVEALVEKLEIPAKVAYLGPEAHTDALWTAYTERKGALVYSYFPNANQHGISILSLERAAIAPGDDFKSQQLQKLAFPGLQDLGGGDALEFVKNFDLSKSDYEELASLNSLFTDPQDAACVWYVQNRDKWKGWVKFPERKRAPFFCLQSDDGLCDSQYLWGWVLFFGQLIACVVLCLYAHYLKRPKPFHTIEERRLGIDKAMNQGMTHIPVVRKQSSLVKWLMDHTGNYKTRAQFVDELADIPPTLTHKRTFENFTKPNTDKSVKSPPPAGADRWTAQLSRSSLFPYLLFSAGDGMRPIIILCLAFGLGSGSLASLFYLLIYWETYQKDAILHAEHKAFSQEGSTMALVKDAAASFESLISSFKFFPSFLQIGYLGYAVSRWRAFQDWGYNIVGALNSTALVVGSSLTMPEAEPCKKLAYRVHRYMVAVHILNYKSFNRWYTALTFQDLIKLGLLLPEEVENLETISLGEQRETLVGWIAREMYEGVKDGLLCHKVKCTLATNIRGNIGGFQAQFYQNQPNLWAALMKFVCDLLIMMFVVGTPFTAFMYESGPLQLFVIISSFLQSIPWLCASGLVSTLSNPYTSEHDMFNTDALVLTSEQTCFANLRSAFNLLEVRRRGGEEPTSLPAGTLNGGYPMPFMAPHAIAGLPVAEGSSIAHSRGFNSAPSIYEPGDSLSPLRARPAAGQAAAALRREEIHFDA